MKRKERFRRFLIYLINKNEEKVIYRSLEEELKDVSETSSPVIALASQIIEDAYRKNASDIHLQPTENSLRVRVRVDGDLTDYLILPKYMVEPLITRYKIIANMKIDEKRLPQDSRINFVKYNPTWFFRRPPSPL